MIIRILSHIVLIQMSFGKQTKTWNDIHDTDDIIKSQAYFFPYDRQDFCQICHISTMYDVNRPLAPNSVKICEGGKS